MLAGFDVLEEIVRWASLVAPILAFVGVWVKFGELRQAVADLTIDMTTIVAKHELLRDDLVRHKVEVAREYATHKDVQDALQVLTRTIDRLGDRLDEAVRRR